MPVVYTGMYKGERFNSISHLVGAALALAGSVVLVTFAAMDGDTRKILSYSVYGLTLFLLYLFSTLYHALAGAAKRVFQVLVDALFGEACLKTCRMGANGEITSPELGGL